MTRSTDTVGSTGTLTRSVHRGAIPSAPVGLSEEAVGVAEWSAESGGTEVGEVKVLPIDEYEAMVAELAELRPLRSRLRAIEGIATGRRLRRAHGVVGI